MLQSASHIPLLADVLLLVYILITVLMITAYDSMRHGLLFDIMLWCTAWQGSVKFVLDRHYFRRIQCQLYSFLKLKKVLDCYIIVLNI